MARLLFSNSSLVNITLQPSENKGWKTIVVFAARLTQEAATILKAGHFFRPNGDPVENISSFALDITLRDIDLVLPSATIDNQFNEHRPDLCYRFRTSEVTKVAIDIQFRAHFTGINRELIDFAEAKGKEVFELAIRSLQTDFDFSGEAPGGTPVDMSADDSEEDEPAQDANGKLFACQHCQAGLQLDPGGATHTTGDGEVVPCADVPFKANAPALASAAQMGAKRKKRTVRAINEAEVAETVTVD
jgi:hypothetical protein